MPAGTAAPTGKLRGVKSIELSQDLLHDLLASGTHLDKEAWRSMSRSCRR